MNPQLDKFVRQVKEKMEAADAVPGKKALEERTKLSAYIAEQTQNLMSQGISVMEIQGALRAAADTVEQTYAPDAADFFNDGKLERLELPIDTFTFFLPVEEATIAAFADGNLDEPGLMDHIRASFDITPLEMTEGLDFVLTGFGKKQELCDIIISGEIVAGRNGEAFIPEYLLVKEVDGYQYSVSDPAVFKSAGEVQFIVTLLEPFDKKTFFRKANGLVRYLKLSNNPIIKKLLKLPWLEDYDPRSVKKEADFIIGELWKEFTALREVYRKASEQGKGMLIFVG
ncbi:MAG: YfbM family protein [Treponema sp.]|jgi:hypothetical protein|nr:YfbM family protein [Treponema sp.]